MRLQRAGILGVASGSVPNTHQRRATSACSTPFLATSHGLTLLPIYSQFRLRSHTCRMWRGGTRGRRRPPSTVCRLRCCLISASLGTAGLLRRHMVAWQHHPAVYSFSVAA